MADFTYKFTALDLETTHLSPEEGRIMEVAAVSGELFFDNAAQKVQAKFDKSFSSLVNPEIEVPHVALALTGIDEKELDSAPLWNEVKAKLVEFLPEDRIIIGHNIEFDLDFLASQGFDLKRDCLDTLQLAQVLVPLVPSHSLDYLAESLGVKIGVSHRALEDSKTASLLLAETLNEFLLLPQPKQTEIKELAEQGRAAFTKLLKKLPDNQRKGESVQRQQTLAVASHELRVIWKDKSIYHLPLSFDQLQEWLVSLATEKKQLVVGAPQQTYLEAVPVQQKIISPLQALCTSRLQSFLNQRRDWDSRVYQVFIRLSISQHYAHPLDLSLVRWLPEEKETLYRLSVDPKLCLKHKCEYYKSITARNQPVYLANARALFSLVEDWQVDFGEYQLVFFNLANAESFLVENNTQLWNLRRVRGYLQQLYPLEAELPSLLPDQPGEVEELVNELDLFFGILHLVYLKREGEYAENVLVESEETGKQRFQKLLAPAEKLISKLKKFDSYLEGRLDFLEGEELLETELLKTRLEQFTDFLDEFFVSRQSDQIYWLRFSDRWVNLNKAPRSIVSLWYEFAESFSGVALVDTVLPKLTLEYFQKRLGIDKYEEVELEVAGREEFDVRVLTGLLETEEALEIVKSDKDSSAIIVLPNVSQLEKFFLAFSQDDGLQQEVLAYKFSGSLSALKAKLREDERAAKPFVLLLTKHIALRSLTRFPYARRLLVQKLPFDPPGVKPAHGLGAAENDFAENTLPRTLHLLHIILARFGAAKKPKGMNSEETKREIILGDPRILSSYNQEFVRYLEELPDVEVKKSKRADSSSSGRALDNE